MLIKNALAITLLAGSTVVGCAIFFPVFAQSKTHESAGKKAYYKRQVDAYLKAKTDYQNGDLKVARMDAEQYLKNYPRSPHGPMLMADVLYGEKRYQEAWEIYRKEILPHLDGFGDTDVLFRFGEAAEKVGHPEDANIAYRRALADHRNFFKSAELLKSIDDKNAKTSDLRAVAKAMVAIASNQSGYIMTIQNAVEQAPNQPATHYAYAQVLWQFGHLRDSYGQIKATAALLPPGDGPEFQSEAYKYLGFNHRDHGTRAVVGKGGKVTVSQFPMPLPNSDRPLVERVYTRAETRP